MLDNIRYPQKQSPFSLKGLIRLFCVGIVIAWLVQGIVSLIGTIDGVQFVHKSLLPILQSRGFLVMTLFIVVIGPIIEEIMFRLWMRPTFPGMIFSLTAIVAYAIGAVYQPSLVPFIYVVMCIFGFIYAVLYKVKNQVNNLSHLFAKHWKWIFIIQGLIFGGLHVMNYSMLDPWWIGAVLVIPQTLLGLILLYERMRWGFGANLLHHMLHNLFLFGPFIAFYILGYDISAIFSHMQDLDSMKITGGMKSVLSFYMILYIIVVVIGVRSIISYFRYGSLLGKEKSSI